jgi:hypothetical protein
VANATREDFAAARAQATEAADLFFDLAQSHYPDDMTHFRKAMADFRQAKDVEKEASAGEIAETLNSFTSSANTRIRTATCAPSLPRSDGTVPAWQSPIGKESTPWPSPVRRWMQAASASMPPAS